MQTIAPDIIAKILSPEFNRRKVNQEYLVDFEQRFAKAGFSTDFVEAEMQQFSNWFDLKAIAEYTYRAFQRASDYAREHGEPLPTPPDFAYIDTLPDVLCPDGTPSHIKSTLIALAIAYVDVLTAHQGQCDINKELTEGRKELKEELASVREDKEDFKRERDEARKEVRRLKEAGKETFTADSLIDSAQLWLNAHPAQGEVCRSLLGALLKGQRQEEVQALRYRSALTDENDRLARQYGKQAELAAARTRLYPLTANPEHVEEFLSGCLRSEGNEELKRLAIKPIAKLNILGTDKIPQKDLVNLTLTLLHYTTGASYPRVEALFSQRNK